MREEGYRSVQIQKSALAALESNRISALGKCSAPVGRFLTSSDYTER
jgi:hypothetical protein